MRLNKGLSSHSTDPRYPVFELSTTPVRHTPSWSVHLGGRVISLGGSEMSLCCDLVIMFTCPWNVWDLLLIPSLAFVAYTSRDGFVASQSQGWFSKKLFLPFEYCCAGGRWRFPRGTSWLHTESFTVSMTFNQVQPNSDPRSMKHLSDWGAYR